MTSTGGACPQEGSGALVVEITGLPTDIDAGVLIAGPEQLEVTAGGTLTGVTAGSYTVTAERVYDADALVRTVFDATVTTSGFCLGADASQTISITYAPVPSSNQLWTATSSHLNAFAVHANAETVQGAATLTANVATLKSVAFDREGNLWAPGTGTDSVAIRRFPAALLGEGRELQPDIAITWPNAACDTHWAHLAFDPKGNLWVPCYDAVWRFAEAELTTGDREPDASLTSLSAPDTIAFDRQGNLWVSVPRKLLRFDAARLGQVDAEPPDLELSVATSTSLSLWPTGFAFDTTGNLWGLSYFENQLFRLTPADLAGTGVRTVEASVVLRVGVATFSTLPAFDDAGGLWFGMSRGMLGRVSPAQLATSSGSFIEPEVELAVVEPWSRTASLAFFPASAGLPLFHSLPAP